MQMITVSHPTQWTSVWPVIRALLVDGNRLVITVPNTCQHETCCMKDLKRFLKFYRVRECTIEIKTGGE